MIADAARAILKSRHLGKRPRAAQVRLLCNCRVRDLKRCHGRSRLIDQWLNYDRGYSDAFDIECVGSSGREVEDAPASVWTPVLDFYDDGAAIVEIRHFRA